MDEKALAYLAGFFDGEGTISTEATSNRVKVAVTNTDIRPINEFRRRFTGHLYRYTVKNGNLPAYRWQVQGNALVVSVLSELLPHLWLKRRRAELAIELCSRWDMRGYKIREHQEEHILRCNLEALITNFNKTGESLEPTPNCILA